MIVAPADAFAEHAHRVLGPSGLSYDDARALARHGGPGAAAAALHDGYTSPEGQCGPSEGVAVGLYDLGLQMRAEDLDAPVPKATFAPVLPINSPIAVTVDGRRTPVVTATDGTTTHERSGRRALRALDDLGVNPGEIHRTLVVPDVATVARLAQLAYDQPTAASATVVGWWDQRADHPGTGAVLSVLGALRDRWALACSPGDVGSLGVWCRWLGVDDEGVGGLLALARLVTAGHCLPGLLECAAADSRSWAYHRDRLAGGWDWRSGDTRVQAALGLATRSHAAEYYDSLRLGDPLVAGRAAYLGTIVAGVVTSADRDRLVIEAARPVSRLRTGARVQGWAGWPGRSAVGGRALSAGVVAGSLIGRDGRLVVEVVDHVARPTPFVTGDVVSLRPRAVDPSQQQRSRQKMSVQLRTGSNWIGGGGEPVVQRTDVPLDVVLAAAGDD